MSKKWLVVVIADALVAALFFLPRAWHGLGGDRVDLDVYRLGVRTWLDGGQLYGVLPPTAGGARLLFTYPPSAMLALLPLAALPGVAANVILTSLTIGAVGLVCWLFIIAAGARRPLAVLACLIPAALLLEPVRTTATDGQVNGVLMAVIAWDCLAPTTVCARWRSGWLVGSAAAVKLVPAVFVMFLVVSGNRAAVWRMAAAFSLWQIAGFIVDPATSWHYWTALVGQTGRIGPPQYAANQSINGVLARLGLTGQTRELVWALSCLVVVLLGVIVIRAAVHDGHRLLGLSVNALVGLLISPISWSHHWVWAVPALLTVLVVGVQGRRWPLVLAGAAGVVVVAVAPQWLLPHGHDRELRWVWWQQLVGSCYCLVGIGFLLVTAWRSRSSRSQDPLVIADAELLPLQPELGLADVV